MRENDLYPEYFVAQAADRIARFERARERQERTPEGNGAFRWLLGNLVGGGRPRRSPPAGRADECR